MVIRCAFLESRPCGHGGRGGALVEGVAMPGIVLRRKIAILLLGAALAVPWSLPAAESRRAVAPRVEAQAVDRPDLAGHLWSFLTSIWAKTGSRLDPNGLATAQQPAPPSPVDEGCHLDPNGLCQQ